MHAPPPDQDAVLIIRLWFEPEHRGGFRARILIGDLDNPSSTVAVSRPEDVIDTVRVWLDAFLETMK